MTIEDTFRLLVGGYFGVQEIEEYTSNIYILKEIENYIRDYVKSYPLSNYDYRYEASLIEELPLKNKLQDALIVLRMINGPLELNLLIKERINKINRENNNI